MSKHQHTKGPWQVYPWFGSLFVVRKEPDEAPDALIARTMGNTDESRADAELLAAAPDLLAACEELLSYLDGPPSDVPPYGAIVRARDAIKKATGGAS